MKIDAIYSAYLISVGLGIPVTWCWSAFFNWRLDKRIPSTGATTRIGWMPVVTGIFERAIVTTLIIWTPVQVPGFIAGWMALKVAGGWGLLKEPTTRNRATNILSLWSSTVSLGMAVIVGVWLFPDAIKALKEN